MENVKQTHTANLTSVTANLDTRVMPTLVRDVLVSNIAICYREYYGNDDLLAQYLYIRVLYSYDMEQYKHTL